MRISVDGRRIRNNKIAFSNLSGIVWTRPQSIKSSTLISCLRPSMRRALKPWFLQAKS